MNHHHKIVGLLNNKKGMIAKLLIVGSKHLKYFCKGGDLSYFELMDTIYVFLRQALL
jgi:hypothetical protein